MKVAINILFTYTFGSFCFLHSSSSSFEMEAYAKVQEVKLFLQYKNTFYILHHFRCRMRCTEIQAENSTGVLVYRPKSDPVLPDITLPPVPIDIFTPVLWICWSALCVFMQVQRCQHNPDNYPSRFDPGLANELMCWVRCICRELPDVAINTPDVFSTHTIKYPHWKVKTEALMLHHGFIATLWQLFIGKVKPGIIKPGGV